MPVQNVHESAHSSGHIFRFICTYTALMGAQKNNQRLQPFEQRLGLLVVENWCEPLSLTYHE